MSQIMLPINYTYSHIKVKTQQIISGITFTITNTEANVLV